MKEPLIELQQRVQSARNALESLADRAAELRGRMEAVRAEDPPFATVAARRRDHDLPGQGQGDGEHDPFMPIRPPASGADLLTQGSRPMIITDFGDGDDGRLVSDAWEIALINEEGK
jgi:hypothetical protein